ncbi:MAG: hypothetical protein K0R28_5781, partial [Paenibacillus sp.]|nr:hypothetical protein [Paenibacillus sp.]
MMGIAKNKKWLIAGIAAMALTTALYAQSLPSIGPGKVYAAEQAAAAQKNVV